MDSPIFAFEDLLSVVKKVFYLIVVHFLLGLLMGFPSSHLPTLQNTTFGDHAFVTVGVFGGVKGFLSILTGPGIGMYSDQFGRREALTLALVLSTLPTLCMAVADSFWAYYVTDALVGIYSGAISVVMACVADTLQMGEEAPLLSSGGGGGAATTASEAAAAAAAVAADAPHQHPSPPSAAAVSAPAASGSSGSTPASQLTSHGTTFAVAEELVRRTRAMSIAMAALGLGFIVATVIGEELSSSNSFRCAAVCGIAASAFTWFYLRSYLDCLSAIARANALAASDGVGSNINVGVYAQPEAAGAATATAADTNDLPPQRSGMTLALDIHESAQEAEQQSQQQQQQQQQSITDDPYQQEDDDDENDDQDSPEHESLVGGNDHHQKKKHKKKSSTHSGADNNKNILSPAADRVIQSSQQYIQTMSRSVHRSHKTLRTYTGLRYLAGIVFCDSLITQAMAVLIPLYLKDALGFTATDQMVMTVIMGLSGFVGLLFIVPFLTARLETMGMLRLALVADMVCVSLYAVVKNKFLAKILPLFTSLGIAMFPCASSLASEVMFGSSAAEGLAQGIVSAARMLAEGVSPLLLGSLLSWFRGSPVPGLPFLFTGLVELVALMLSQKLVQFMALPSAWRYETEEPSPVHLR